jgi:hypothetical protein
MTCSEHRPSRVTVGDELVGATSERREPTAQYLDRLGRADAPAGCGSAARVDVATKSSKGPSVAESAQTAVESAIGFLARCKAHANQHG